MCGRNLTLIARDTHCLRCDADLDADEVPYIQTLGCENGVEYALCWDCMSTEHQSEISDWEETIPEGDRLLS